MEKFDTKRVTPRAGGSEEDERHLARLKKIEAESLRRLDHHKNLEQQGNAEGQCVMGIRYLNGWQVEKDTCKGMNLLDLAAKQNHVKACYELCKIYMVGTPYIQRNYQAVREYINLAEVKPQYCEVALQEKRMVQLEAFTDLLKLAM